ncbi:uncharacterized protein LOC132753068 [Ruditapes philippinarum]|uniref:uncharacterized protein LOC132753068 n=1 Tax=Ruditapes philippinarum TaxID=129788 RepID=UPI00295BDF9C|nr:uncharacterized protein LOC132753068 [Ruditapes philippinarum]
MVHCVAFGCRNKSDGGTKGFFLFPKDDTLRKKCTNAVKSLRNVNGTLKPFVPTKTSRLCSRHFTDESFVHPPSIMNSVGLTLKLQLVKGAVPTIFPEIEAFKNNNKPSSVSHLGPPKRKRTSYGGFEKRNRKSCVDELIKSQELLEKEEEERQRIEEVLSSEVVEEGSLH